jgi:hypothetical protein
MNKITVFSTVLIFLPIFFLGAGPALSDHDIDPGLERSRNALLEQRDHLQQEADVLKRQIDSLQQRLSVVYDRLRDNDQALKDVERSMRY